jgi:hypothetical protein
MLVLSCLFYNVFINNKNIIMNNKINFLNKIKILIIFILFFLPFLYTYADTDYINDYTLIDCINWDDSTWIAFDSQQPYQTLKWWIEKTIEYINKNINTSWNKETASWIVLNIKIECSINDILNSEISLNFDWNKYNNELVIEWVHDNSFIIKNTILYLPNWKWNIKIINASFLPGEKYKYYIKSQNNIKDYKSTWIKIVNSYVKLLKDYNFWIDNYYTYLSWLSRNRTLNFVYYYNNQQLIEWSIIDVDIDWNYTFISPVLIKDTKINFNNLAWSWSVYDIKFSYNSDKSNSSAITQFFSLISNEFNFWWNNFSIINSKNISFINNKFSNFNNFNFWWAWIFINNLIENNTSIDISDFKNLFNNVFKSGFTDTYDIFNYRKNYYVDNVWPKWIGWVFKRNHEYNYFDLDLSSSLLYKEITWNEIPNWLWEIYVIFNF